MATKSSSVPDVRSKVPQFTLRTMFLLITGLGILFALLETIGWAASFGLLLIATLVGLHVLGNALGTKLRDETSAATGQRTIIASALPPLQHAVPIDRPNTVSRLYQRARLGWIIHFATFAGAVAGGCLGAEFLVNFANTSPRGVILGAVSSALLGAFFGFLYGSFLKTWLSAWWQAASESEKLDRRIATTATLLPTITNEVSASLAPDIEAG